jgi:hypothetical protein
MQCGRTGVPHLPRMPRFFRFPALRARVCGAHTRKARQVRHPRHLLHKAAERAGLWGEMMAMLMHNQGMSWPDRYGRLSPKPCWRTDRLLLPDKRVSTIAHPKLRRING